MMGANRADPFAETLDLSDFAPTPAKALGISKEAIRTASEAKQFPSRAARSDVPPAKKARRGRRTGRNVQFNMKVTQQVVDRCTALADANNWVFGELLEYALDALEREIEAKKSA